MGYEKANTTMKRIYKINPPKPLPPDLVSDKNKRAKVESILGKKLTDTEWFNYKIMLQGIKK